MNTEDENEKYLKSSGLWSFSVLVLAVMSFLSFIPTVILPSSPESLLQQVFELLLIVGICASMVLPFVELYLEDKFRKKREVSNVIFWRKFALFHWLIFSLLIYIASTYSWS